MPGITWRLCKSKTFNVERSKSRGAFRRLSWRNYKGQISLEALQNFKFNFKLSPNSIYCSLQWVCQWENRLRIAMQCKLSPFHSILYTYSRMIPCPLLQLHYKLELRKISSSLSLSSLQDRELRISVREADSMKLQIPTEHISTRSNQPSPKSPNATHDLSPVDRRENSLDTCC